MHISILPVKLRFRQCLVHVSTYSKILINEAVRRTMRKTDLGISMTGSGMINPENDGDSDVGFEH